jgi:hypothetical protein
VDERTNESCNEAFDRVEDVYRRHFANRAVVRRLVKLYGSDALHLAFKKALLEQLTEFLYYRLLVERVRQALSWAENLVIVLEDPRNAHQQRRLGRLVFEDVGERRSGWRPPWWTVATGVLMSWKAKLGLCLLAGRLLKRCVASRLCRPKAKKASVYDIAVAVVSPLRELHDGSRAAGFLADGACIRKEQLLLVPVARLGDREISWLRGQGFRVSDPEPPVSWRVLTQVVRGIAHVALSLRADPVWLSGTAASLVRSLAVWRPFTERFRIAKFVTYADFGLGHIARNIILKESGASVWHYLDGC